MWLSAEGLPKKGLLSFEFFAGDAMNMFGCLLDRKLRGILSGLTLVNHRDIAVEYELNPWTRESTSIVAMKENSNATTSASSSSVVAVVPKISKFRKAPAPVVTASSSDNATTDTVKVAPPVVFIKTIAMLVSLGPSMKCLAAQLSLLSKQFKKKIKSSRVPSASSSSSSIVGRSSIGVEINNSSNRVVFNYLDANDHLRTTDVTWTYEDGDYGRVESWKLI